MDKINTRKKHRLIGWCFLLGGIKIATTRLMHIHANKGKTITQTICDSLDYVENPDKTNNSKRITGYQCAPQMAGAQFLISQKHYTTIGSV